MRQTTSQIHVYTDGACIPNPGKGGWGWVAYHILDGSTILNFYNCGGSRTTTNNKMELTAVIEFLKYAPQGPGFAYLIHSDSQYVLKGLVKGGNGVLRTPGVYSGWMGSWLKMGFKKNPEYWKALNILIQRQLKAGTQLEFKYVHGHSGNKGNNRADKLAKMGIP